MRIIVATIFACIVAMIVMAPHHPGQQPLATNTTVVTSPLPTQDCMNSAAGADGYAPPTQDCLSSLP
jgi:hypothetical protein